MRNNEQNEEHFIDAYRSLGDGLRPKPIHKKHLGKTVTLFESTAYISLFFFFFFHSAFPMRCVAMTSKIKPCSFCTREANWTLSNKYRNPSRKLIQSRSESRQELHLTHRALWSCKTFFFYSQEDTTRFYNSCYRGGGLFS